MLSVPGNVAAVTEGRRRRSNESKQGNVQIELKVRNRDCNYYRDDEKEVELEPDDCLLDSFPLFT